MLDLEKMRAEIAALKDGKYTGTPANVLRRNIDRALEIVDRYAGQANEVSGRPARDALDELRYRAANDGPLVDGMLIAARALVEAIDVQTQVIRQEAPYMDAVVDRLDRSLTHALSVLEGFLLRNR